MKLEIIDMHAPILRTTTQHVPLELISTNEVQDHIEQMKKIFYQNPAVGLAAPQVGWDARVFIIEVDKQYDPLGIGIPMSVYINPEYQVIDEKKLTDWEGCFSVFNEDRPHLHGEVKRSAGIRFRAYNQQGELVQGELTGYPARVFQHEYDHLDGIRFVNRMTNASPFLIQTSGSRYRIYLHQLPEILRNNQFPELQELVPLILEAPTKSINKKLLEQIQKAYAAVKNLK